MDFRKGVVDILAVQNFVAAMVIGNSDDQAKYLNNPGADDSANTGMGISGFTSWLSGDAVEQDTAAVDAQLHNETPILLANEKCQKAYKTGRDLYVYTTHRVIIVDVQGIMGKRVEYSVRVSPPNKKSIQITVLLLLRRQISRTETLFSCGANPTLYFIFIFSITIYCRVFL